MFFNFSLSGFYNCSNISNSKFNVMKKNILYTLFDINFNCYPLILTIITLSLNSFAQTPPVVMQWASHVDTKNGPCSGGGGPDWIENLKHTHDGGYIACGFSPSSDVDAVSSNCIYGVAPALYRYDPFGNLMWQKVYPLEPLNHGNCQSTPQGDYGSFLDVVETSSGNIVGVGYKKRDFLKPNDPSGDYWCSVFSGFVILTDQDGNELNSGTEFPPYYDNDMDCGVGNPCDRPGTVYTCILETPDKRFLSGGAARRSIAEQSNAVLVITDGFSYPIAPSWEYNDPNNMNEGFGNLVIINPNPFTGDFDLIVAGGEDLPNPISVNGWNADQSQFISGNVTTSKSILLRLSYTSGAFAAAAVWYNSFDYSGTFQPAGRIFNDFGPAYGSNGAACPTSIVNYCSGTCGCPGTGYYSYQFSNNASPYILDYLNNVHKCSASGLLINQSGEIVLANYVDLYQINNLEYNSNFSGIHDCSRSYLDNYVPGTVDLCG